jgi:hypothetical protein
VDQMQKLCVCRRFRQRRQRPGGHPAGNPASSFAARFFMPDLGPLPSMQSGGQRPRSARKNVVTSAASSSGASSAAKCPPRGISVHRWMLKTCSANERGGCRISRGRTRRRWVCGRA